MNKQKMQHLAQYEPYGAHKPHLMNIQKMQYLAQYDPFGAHKPLCPIITT